VIQVSSASRDRPASASHPRASVNPASLQEANSARKASRYRPDIDGLRAVAVISVMIYHLGLVLPGKAINRVSGGFIGVDVFFVISGYLITGIIQRQIVSGNFSFADFYSRRMRRILPAFYCILLCVSVLAGLHLFPEEVSTYNRSAISAILSVSNVYFWKTTNYFAGPAMSKPLLHTWSLSVEEQFYIVWPLLLVLIARFRPRMLRMIIILLAACSFLLSAIGVWRWPDATFYLVFGRIWELSLGGMLALNILPAPRAAWVRQIIGVLGFGMIAFADLMFTTDTPFPGAAALVPCLGAGLIIAAGEKGGHAVGRMLAWKPMVFVGLISYSLYLWHWPIFVFQRMFSLFPGGDLGKKVKVEVLLATFVLATLTWRFVEQPLRHVRWSHRRVFSTGIACAVFSMLFCFVVQAFSNALTPAPARAAASFLNYLERKPELEATQLQGDQRVTKAWVDAVLRIDPSKKNYLVLADSHANHLVPGLQHVFPEANFVRATGSSCRLLVPGEHYKPHCDSIFQYLYTDFFPNNKIDGIILEGRWDLESAKDIDAFSKWAQSHGYPVIVLGPMIQYDQPLPRLIAESIRQHDPSVITRHRLELRPVAAAVQQVAARDHLTFISWTDILCHNDQCPTTTEDGTPLLYDYGHLTEEGAIFVATKLRASGAFDFAMGPAPANRAAGGRSQDANSKASGH
jgi:peptidoglycan/LPS O-acetylase OafA/YrhL